MSGQLVERFLSKVCRNPDNGCWEWTGHTRRLGYGHFSIGQRKVRAHRWAYEHFVGAIPAGLEIDHLCGNKACVNPEHLEAVTHRENMLRSSTPHILLYHANLCKNGHSLLTDSYLNPSGHRRCRICTRERTRRWAAARRGVA